MFAIGYMDKILCTLILVLVPNLVLAAPTVSVTGQCRKLVTPDRIGVTMTARATEKDPGAAQKKATAQYENLRKEIKKLNLKDAQLQTANYSVNADWEYNNNKRTLRGYTATAGLRIETSETSRITEVLALSAKLGLQDVESPSTFLSPDLTQKEYEACLKVAVESARSKAEKMADAAGKKILELATLDETREPIALPQPMGKSMQMAEMAADSGPTFEIRPEQIEVTIFAKYNLK